MTIRFLSVCSGIEAASLAFEPLGWAAVGFAEIAPFPSAVLAARFGSNLPGEPLSRNAPPNFGDFTTIDPRTVGRVDVLSGGTPCQAFSVAGRRGSLSDARGNLTLAFATLAHGLTEHAGLRNAIWENVPGVLSLDDNAFGCFLGELVGADDPLLPGERPVRGRSSDVWRWKAGDDGVLRHFPRWPRAGMVAGPLARAAWRVLDAQYFGLAQRRERVLLIVDFGGGADPAEVLFEPEGLRRNPAPRREAREGIARPLASSPRGGSGYRNDADTAENIIVEPADRVPVQGLRGAQCGDVVSDLRMVLPRAYGGSNTSGEIAVATALTAHSGPHGRCDFESETFIVANTPLGKANDSHAADLSTYVSHALRAEGFDASEDGTGRGTPIVPICFDTTQITHPENRCNPRPGGPSHPLSTSAHPPAVAFDLRGREGGAQFEGPHETANIRAASGGSSRSYVAAPGTGGWAVRRLTPRECERLQGIPDDHTAIVYRGRPAADGPRYSSIGNSWAVKVFAWVGRRLDAALRAKEAV